MFIAVVSLFGLAAWRVSTISKPAKRAAYCLGLLPHMSSQLSARVEDQVTRLQLYLASRVLLTDELLNTTAMSAASGMGKLDGQRTYREVVSCAAGCPGRSDDRHRSCMDTCTGNKGLNVIFEKYKSCLDPTWLPF